jgi:hypothetical protein
MGKSVLRRKNMAIKVVTLDQADLTILPDSISYYEDNILK